MPNLKPIQHIVFPVDFSERCAGAVPFVADMARRTDAKITLLSVAHPFYGGGLAGAAVIDPQMILDSVQAELDQTFVKELAGLNVNRIAILGDPAQTIVDFVHENGVDLVMMPTHGYGPFRQLLLGSVTAKVLHDVKCPVWTMAHSGDAPGLEHLAIQKILCGVDVSPAAAGLMRWSADLAKNFGSTLRLVHAVPGIEAWPERQMDEEFQMEVRDGAGRAVQDLERTVCIDVPVCVAAGTVPDVVREEALQHGADLVVIGRGALQQKLGRLRTHSYGIIRHSPCPVISV
jgi:nucleotide-binding universal stress UspA family protein